MMPCVDTTTFAIPEALRELKRRLAAQRVTAAAALVESGSYRLSAGDLEATITLVRGDSP